MVVRVVVSLKMSIRTQQANIVADAYEVEEEEIMWFVGTSSFDLVARVMISLLLLLLSRRTMTMMVRMRKCNNDNDYAVLNS